MFQVQAQIAALPLDLVLLSSGEAVLVWRNTIQPVVEQDGVVNAYLMRDGFFLHGHGTLEEYSYQVPYALRDFPLLKEWLQAQAFQIGGVWNVPKRSV